MKKALSLILALAMALSLAACGGGKTETPSDSNTPADNTSAEPTKLSLILRGGTYADVIKECLPAFEAEHNVVCEVQELSEGDLYSGIALDAINDKGSYDRAWWTVPGWQSSPRTAFWPTSPSWATLWMRT